MALVFLLINFDIFFGSRHKVVLSMSTKTGVIPNSNAALAVLWKVNEDIIISSPYFRPAAFKATLIASVPLDTQRP